MTILRTAGLSIALAMGGKLLLRNSPRYCLTTVLFHKFTFDGESLAKARDRLKYQCEWLKKNYSPMTLTAATDGLSAGRLPNMPLLITIDDAHIDTLDVFDIFRTFELPIAIFVCAGWCANASPAEDDTKLAGLVSDLEWYSGPEKELSFPCGRLKIQRDKRHRREMITSLIKDREKWKPFFEEIVRELRSNRPARPRNFCNWQELIELQRCDVEIGCHSVSHMNLAESDESRAEFEICEAKKILSSKFGECGTFAYPFGIPGSFSTLTSETLKRAGFQFAFLTRSDFATGREDPHELPRISLPDRPLALAEFRARVGGGGIVIANLRNYIRGNAKYRQATTNP
jgi:peptidoglycan/xylan/chitin deacetylase (PgdA/CDA1 family)